MHVRRSIQDAFHIKTMNITPSHIPASPAMGMPHVAVRADMTAEKSADTRQDTVSISKGSRAESSGESSKAGRDSGRNGHGISTSQEPKAPDGHELNQEELRQLEELQQRDREVHAHEQAHIAAGGRYVRSGASYHYQTGPDGKKYAIGGEVSIDTSEEKDPKATIRKMETVRKAALAPARPSAQDRAIAAQAGRKMAEAAAELAKMQAEGEDQAHQAGKTQHTGNRPSAASTPSGTDSSATAQAVPAAAGSIINAYV